MGANGAQLAERADVEVGDGFAEDLGTEPAPVESSALDRLRARREELRKERHVDIDVPGYGGELVVRFRPVPWDQLHAIARKHERSSNPRKELLGQVDTLIAACDEVLIRVDGELQSMPDGPVHEFAALPDLIGYEADTHRNAVFGLFNNDLAVTLVHNELAEWMGGADEETDEDLAGE